MMTVSTLTSVLARRRREHEVQALGRGDQQVGRLADQRLAILRRGVAGAHRDVGSTNGSPAARPRGRCPSAARAGSSRRRTPARAAARCTAPGCAPSDRRRRRAWCTAGRSTRGTPSASCRCRSARRSACAARSTMCRPALHLRRRRRRERGREPAAHGRREPLEHRVISHAPRLRPGCDRVPRPSPRVMPCRGSPGRRATTGRRPMSSGRPPPRSRARRRDASSCGRGSAPRSSSSPRSSRPTSSPSPRPAPARRRSRSTCARWALGQERRRVIVVAPTSHLKTQWAQAAHRLGLELDPDWTPSGRPRPRRARPRHHLPARRHRRAPRRRCAASPHDAFVILDEIHHAGDERAWGDGDPHRVRTRRPPARAQRHAVPQRHRRDPVRPLRRTGRRRARANSDYTYGYADALRDGGVVRPVYFPRIDGLMEWSAPDGSVVSANFHDELARDGMAHRLRTALSLDGDWLPRCSRQAHDRLMRSAPAAAASPTPAAW